MDYDLNATTLLFVYGTMMTGGRNHDRLDNAVFLREGETDYMHIDMYMRWSEGLYYAPILVFNSNNKSKLFGELYRLSQADLRFIDIFEGHPLIYKRILVQSAFPEFGNTMYIYSYQNKLAEVYQHRIKPLNDILRFNV